MKVRTDVYWRIDDCNRQIRKRIKKGWALRSAQWDPPTERVFVVWEKPEAEPGQCSENRDIGVESLRD